MLKTRDLSSLKTKQQLIRESVLPKYLPGWFNLPNIVLEQDLDLHTLLTTYNYAKLYSNWGKRKLSEHLVKILSSIFNAPEWVFTIVTSGDIVSKPIGELDVFMNREYLATLMRIFPIRIDTKRTHFGEVILYIHIPETWLDEMDKKMWNLIVEGKIHLT